MDPLACPDILAERRFAYGQAALADGDAEAASDLFTQALERAPAWAPAWFALGEARQKLGDLAGAARAFREALAHAPEDALGAAPRLALAEGHDVGALPSAYIARLFDDYAPRFDIHLTQTLGYRGPDVIAEALERVAPGRRFALALDLGCGSGLAGHVMRERAQYLVGVDLSAGMVAKARETGLYDALEVADLLNFLRGRPQASADLAVAADTLVYVGDLHPAFAATAAVLSAGGLFAFTLERGEAPFTLGETLRFRHADSHVRAAAEAAGLRVGHLFQASTRREAGGEAQGLVVVLEKP